MEQINIKRSIGSKRGRQHASREDALRMTKEREQEEYDTCGIGKRSNILAVDEHTRNFAVFQKFPIFLIRPNAKC